MRRPGSRRPARPRPEAGHEPHGLGLDPPQGEAERPQRRRIAPLHVVQCNEQRALGRKSAERGDDRQAEPERVDGMRLVGVEPPQGDVERSRLRSGQVELCKLDGLEQLGENAEWKFRLGLRRACGEDREPDACVRATVSSSSADLP